MYLRSRATTWDVVGADLGWRQAVGKTQLCADLRALPLVRPKMSFVTTYDYHLTVRSYNYNGKILECLLIR